MLWLSLDPFIAHELTYYVLFQIASEACYILFNGSESSSTYYGKEADIVILDKGRVSPFFFFFF